MADTKTFSYEIRPNAQSQWILSGDLIPYPLRFGSMEDALGHAKWKGESGICCVKILSLDGTLVEEKRFDVSREDQGLRMFGS